MPDAKNKPTIWTIGHSTRSAEETLKILAAAKIKLLADVRRFPGSRRYPHFNQDVMQGWLAEAGIEYSHFVDLGGRRNKRLPDSPNTGWRVEAFGGYADHMQSPEFVAALDRLIAAAKEKRTAIMCSEALPHRCHRRLISDALVVRGWRVCHLLSPKRIDDHQLTPFARVEGEKITYPAETLF